MLDEDDRNPRGQITDRIVGPDRFFSQWIRLFDQPVLGVIFEDPILTLGIRDFNQVAVSVIDCLGDMIQRIGELDYPIYVIIGIGPGLALGVRNAEFIPNGVIRIACCMRLGIRGRY